jgi:hypothetical protein
MKYTNIKDINNTIVESATRLFHKTTMFVGKKAMNSGNRSTEIVLSRNPYNPIGCI